MSQDTKLTDLLSRPISRRLIISRSAVAVGAIAAVGVAGSQLVMASEGTATPPASPASSPAASPAAGTEIEIATEDIKFDPKELTIPANTEVKIKVTNKGVLQHDFHIDKLNITSKLLNAGESDTVTVKASAGTYEFWCTVPGHKEAGMVGTLTVK
ncbi:MAG: cupredoxin domain-containing protein [Thermomicrobiales bacterium]